MKCPNCHQEIGPLGFSNFFIPASCPDCGVKLSYALNKLAFGIVMLSGFVVLMLVIPHLSKGGLFWFFTGFIVYILLAIYVLIKSGLGYIVVYKVYKDIKEEEK